MLFRWTTPLHNSRDEAERSIDEAKTQIATLERQLIRQGWTRDMLNAKERQINEQKARSLRNCKKEKEEVKIEQEKQEILVEKQVIYRFDVSRCIAHYTHSS